MAGHVDPLIPEDIITQYTFVTYQIRAWDYPSVQDAIMFLRYHPSLQEKFTAAQAAHGVDWSTFPARVASISDLATLRNVLRMYLGYYVCLRDATGSLDPDPATGAARPEPPAGVEISKASISWFLNQLRYMKMYGHIMHNDKDQPQAANIVSMGHAGGALPIPAPAPAPPVTIASGKLFEANTDTYRKLQNCNPTTTSQGETTTMWLEATTSVQYSGQAFTASRKVYRMWQPWAKQSEELNNKAIEIYDREKATNPYDTWKTARVATGDSSDMVAYNRWLYKQIEMDAEFIAKNHALPNAPVFTFEPSENMFRQSMNSLTRLIPDFITLYDLDGNKQDNSGNTLYNNKELLLVDVTAQGHASPFYYFFNLIVSTRVSIDEGLCDYYISELNNYVRQPPDIDLGQISICIPLQKLLDLNAMIKQHNEAHEMSENRLLCMAFELLKNAKLHYTNLEQMQIQYAPYFQTIGKLKIECDSISQYNANPISDATRRAHITGDPLTATSVIDLMQKLLILLDRYDQPTADTAYSIRRGLSDQDVNHPFAVRKHPKDTPHSAQTALLNMRGDQSALLAGVEYSDDINDINCHPTVLINSCLRGEIDREGLLYLMEKNAVLATAHPIGAMNGRATTLVSPRKPPLSVRRSARSPSGSHYAPGKGFTSDQKDQMDGLQRKPQTYGDSHDMSSNLTAPSPSASAMQRMRAQRAPALPGAGFTSRGTQRPPVPTSGQLFDPSRARNASNPFKVRNPGFGKDHEGGQDVIRPVPKRRAAWSQQRLRDYGAGLRQILDKAPTQPNGGKLLTPDLLTRITSMSRYLSDAVLHIGAGDLSYASDEHLANVHDAILQIDTDFADEMAACNFTDFAPAHTVMLADSACSPPAPPVVGNVPAGGGGGAQDVGESSGHTDTEGSDSDAASVESDAEISFSR